MNAKICRDRRPCGLFVCLVSGCLFPAHISGQGTILFDTNVPGIVDARFTYDFVTPINGEEYVAQLFGAAGRPAAGPLFPTTRFYLSGEGPLGYVVPVVVTVPGVLPGEEFSVQMQVTSETDRFTVGDTSAITIILGGGGQPPAFLTGLRGSILVPEPTTFGLALIGAAVFFCFVRVSHRKTAYCPDHG
jgi:hypothetical protein